MLVDYITPAWYGVLYRSFRNSHMVVFAAVIVSMLIKLAIIVSTGLFTPVAVTILRSNINVTVFNEFGNMSALASDQWDDLGHGECASLPMSFNKFNASLPFGTTMSHAFQQFEADDGNKEDMSTVVDAFAPTFKCEISNFTLEAREFPHSPGHGSASPSPLFGGSLRSTSWSADFVNMDHSISTVPDDNSTWLLVSEGPLLSNTGLCRDAESNVLEDCFYLAFGHYKPANETVWVPDHLLDSFGVICRAEYYTTKAKVLLPSGSSLLTPQISEIPESRSSLSTSSTRDLLDDFRLAISSTDYFQGGATIDIWHLINSTILETPLPSLSDPPKNFRRGDVLRGLERAHAAVTSQLVSRYYMHQKREYQNGESVFQQTRLSVADASFWVIEACLTLCSLLTVGVMLMSRPMTASQDTSIIGVTAAILARSPEYAQLLSGTGASDLGALRDRLKSWDFEAITTATTRTKEYTIQGYRCTYEDEPDDVSKDQQQPKLRLIQPFPFSITGRILFCIAPVAVLITLELTLRYSESHTGIAKVDPDTRSHYAWTLIPSLALAGVALLPPILDFIIKIYQPYRALRSQRCSAALSITENHLNKVALWSFFSACKKRQYSIIAISIAVFAAPFLTIFISGCFSPIPTPRNTQVTLVQPDAFHLAYLNSQEDINTIHDPSDGMLAANMILGYNLGDSQWTQKNLVFPKLEQVPTYDGSGIQKIPSNMTVRVRLPALRGVANCTVAPRTIDTSICSAADQFQQYLDQVRQNISQPYNDQLHSCTDGEFSSIGPSIHYGQWFSGPIGTNPSEFSLYDGPLGNISFAAHGDCPRAIATFGKVVNNVTTQETTLLCKPFTEQVMADVEFALPDFAISSRNPPITDEATATFYSNASITRCSQCPIYGDLAFPRTGEIPLSAPQSFWNRSFASHYSLDEPFLLAAYGPLGISPVERLLDASTLSATLDSVYGAYMAQVLNTQRASRSTPLFINATRVDPNAFRLVQDVRSTRVLQALLATIAASILAAFVLTGRGNGAVLPKEPGSVAAVASLLVGSELLTRIPEGAEFMGPRELEEEVFKGMVFTMGWWGEEGNRRFGIDVGQAERDR